MNLVLLTHAFAPSVGGVETVTRILADRFHAAGYNVTVVTSSTDPDQTFDAPYTVVRRPSFKQLFSILRAAEAVIQSNITLTLAWPFYLPRVLAPLGIFRSLRHKSFVTVLHSPVSIPGHRIRLQEKLKHLCLRYGTNYAVSFYLRQGFAAPCGLMPNPYGEDIFRVNPSIPRTQPLLFVGRLTTAKGCEIAIDALSILNRSAPEPLHLNIVGNGPDEATLRQQAITLGLEPCVHFLGPVQGAALAELMNQHVLLLVPSRSRPPESLPIVVLEAIASGCIPIVSSQGGLPEAIGPCGITFPEGDALALADRITATLNSPILRSSLQAGAEAHLSRHRLHNVIAAYEVAINGQYHRPVKPSV